MKLETGSAINTPFTPRFPICGRIYISGITITTFLNNEKKTACFERQSAVNVDCPANWNDIIKNP